MEKIDLFNELEERENKIKKDYECLKREKLKEKINIFNNFIRYNYNNFLILDKLWEKIFLLIDEEDIYFEYYYSYVKIKKEINNGCAYCLPISIHSKELLTIEDLEQKENKKDLINLLECFIYNEEKIQATIDNMIDRFIEEYKTKIDNMEKFLEDNKKNKE